MGFSTNDNSVRVDRFKPSGKWYDTIALSVDSWENPDMWTAYEIAFENQTGKKLEKDWMLVILEPWNQYSHPIIIKGK